MMASSGILKKYIAMFHGLSEFGILFNYQGRHVDFPSNVMALPWIAPQAVILRHSNVKVFFTHGGAKSFKETICAEIPAVYVPLFADQHRNALSAKVWGFAEILDKTNLDSREMVQTVLKVINNSSYLKAVKRAKAIWVDKVVPPIQAGAFWSEYIVRHGGWPRFYKRRSVDLFWYQYWCVDVMLSVAGVLCFFICVLWKLVIWCCVDVM